MSTCLSHLYYERGLMISGDIQGDDLVTQLEEMFGPAKAPGEPRKKRRKKNDKRPNNRQLQ